MADINTLLDVLRDYDIPYDHAALESAYEDPESRPAMQAWLDEYLSHETLLTREEAALYANLIKNEQFDATQDISGIQALDDTEMKDAVEELKRSTAAIEEQTKILRMQQVAMNVLVKGNARSGQTRSQAGRNQQRKWNAERGQVNAAVEELAQSLKYQTVDLKLLSKTSDSTAKQTVESILRSDDKLLHSLQKLASDLDPGTDDDGLIARIRDLCARLIKHTVEGTRTKLDRIYLDALQGSQDGADGNKNNQELVDLQEELESLYSEILPVAQMSAEQQFLQPALREVAARDGQGQERSVKAVKYIDDCLNFLNARIEAFLERVEEQQCHKMALQYVLNEAKKELQPAEQISGTASLSERMNLPRRRTLTGNPARDRRRRSSGQFDEVDPEQQLLNTLGISVPTATADAARIDIFERTLSDRLRKLDGHAKSLQSTSESSISSHLLDAHLALQLLQDSLLSDSPYKQVHLLNVSTDADVAAFGKELKDLQEKIEAVDVQKLHMRNVNKEQLIERWVR